MKEFFTRETANKGVKLPLYYPDGTVSEHWIRVRGVDSDHFRRAEAVAKRSAIELAQINNEDERAKLILEKELECIASLVASWSFPDACNLKNVVNFLHEAPQISEMINKFAIKRSEFFKKKLKNSTAGAKTK